MYVFVYGTLKRGGPLNYIMEGAEFVCEGETASNDFVMKDLGYYPGVVRHPNGTTIKGELYEASDSLLARLDRAEGVPHLYTRDKVTVVCEDEEFEAFIYLFNDGMDGRATKFITNGEWINGKGR